MKDKKSQFTAIAARRVGPEVEVTSTDHNEEERERKRHFGERKI